MCRSVSVAIGKDVKVFLIVDFMLRNLRVGIKICINFICTKLFIKMTGKESFQPLTVDTVVFLVKG